MMPVAPNNQMLQTGGRQSRSRRPRLVAGRSAAEWLASSDGGVS